MRREAGADPRTLELTFRERAAPAGSPQYYALLFADSELRPALAALYAFEAEMRAAVHPSIEHAAAHLKLAWWAEELERIARRTPLHPISRALVLAADPLNIDLSALADLLTAARFDLAGHPLTDTEQLLAYCQRSGAVTQQLAAGFAQPAVDRRTETRRFGSLLGRGLRLTQLLRSHVEDAKAGRLRLPQDRLLAIGLAPPDFLAQPRPAGATALLDELAGRAAELLTAAIAMPLADRSRQRAGLVLAELAFASVRRMRTAGFSAPSLRAPPAFRLLWRAWRTARRS
ncbi:MAG TPA: squalene/phytoene synthase family protein [Steroidobacteraceae bacterium]|nr:squalene/phytoene synthase family protein [Steroidobacteraceae bacterium]